MPCPASIHFPYLLSPCRVMVPSHPGGPEWNQLCHHGLGNDCVPCGTELLPGHAATQAQPESSAGAVYCTVTKAGHAERDRGPPTWAKLLVRPWRLSFLLLPGILGSEPAPLHRAVPALGSMQPAAPHLLACAHLHSCRSSLWPQGLLFPPGCQAMKAAVEAGLTPPPYCPERGPQWYVLKEQHI